MIYVSGHHVPLNEFPDDHAYRIESAELVIVDPMGQEVARFPDRRWAAVGRQPHHAYFDDDPACRTCHPGD